MSATARFEIGVVNRPRAGSDVSGDDIVVHEEGEHVLVGLADGLGHGPSAAAAATAFSVAVREAAGSPLVEIFRRADRRLVGTRGAVAGLLLADLAHGSLEAGVVGNVGFRARGARRMSLISLPGVLGRLGAARPRPFAFDLSAGDVVVLHSDGLAQLFDLEPIAGLGAQEAAEELIRSHGKDDDDASCVVVRFLSGSGPA